MTIAEKIFGNAVGAFVMRAKDYLTSEPLPVTSEDLGGGKRGLDVSDPLSSDILTALELLLYGQEDTNLWLEIIANELEA